MHSPSSILPGEEGLKALFKKSRSCFRTLTSRRSLLSSSRSSEVSPSRSPWSISACLSQRRLSDSSVIPSSLATWRKDFSEERKSRTASSRNSGGYGAPLIGMWITSSWIPIPLLQLSTNPTQFRDRRDAGVMLEGEAHPYPGHLIARHAPFRDAKRRGHGWLARQADIGWSNSIGWYLCASLFWPL